MRKIDPPVVDAGTLLAICISGVQDAVAVARLNGAMPAMLATAASYETSAMAAALHTIPQSATVGAASAKDMIDLYKDQMVAPKGPARAYYDLIRNGSPHSKCPLCGVGIVRTLDHHLPKSKYPDLSVCPRNLVPACDFCQTGKLAKHPANAGEQTLHPYYDDFNNEQWIIGSVNRIDNPVIQFAAAPPAAWPAIDKQRVQRHFDIVRLATLYTSNANDDLSTMRDQLIGLAARGGPVAVFDHLDGERIRWLSRLNSWQHVTYQTLSSDPWFVNGGYLKIPV